MTLAKVDLASSEIDLILKSQSNINWHQGLIEVLYDPTAKVVQVWTFSNSQGWVQYGANIFVTFVDGDKFGAWAKADGTVNVYRNGILLGSRSVASWQYNNQGGYIGLWMVNAPAMLMDDFGGGNH